MEATIEIQFAEEQEFSDILNRLEHDQWSYDDHGQVTFLDNDDFDWESGSLDQLDEIKKHLNEVSANGGVVSIVLLQPNDLGINVNLFNDKRKVVISISVNRKVVGKNVTDFSFYLLKLEHLLASSTSVKCEQIH